jgi:hypothetical protein
MDTPFSAVGRLIDDASAVFEAKEFIREPNEL